MCEPFGAWDDNDDWEERNWCACMAASGDRMMMQQTPAGNRKKGRVGQVIVCGGWSAATDAASPNSLRSNRLGQGGESIEVV